MGRKARLLQVEKIIYGSNHFLSFSLSLSPSLSFSPSAAELQQPLNLKSLKLLNWKIMSDAEKCAAEDLGNK